MQSRKGLKNENISYGLFFFERYTFITVRVCVNKFSYALTRFIQFVLTHRHSTSYKTISFQNKQSVDLMYIFQ